jgi:hypothetical protein
MRALVEAAISGADHPVPAEERPYVQQTVAAPTAPEKFAAYSQGLVAIHRQLAPNFLSLRTAAATDADCAALWN